MIILLVSISQHHHTLSLNTNPGPGVRSPQHNILSNRSLYLCETSQHVVSNTTVSEGLGLSPGEDPHCNVFPVVTYSDGGDDEEVTVLSQLVFGRWNDPETER